MRSRFALVTAVLVCAFAAGAKSPATLINVQVSTMDGKPIEHADVEVKLVKGEKTRTMWKLRTHEEGLVKAPNEIPQGTILVEVAASGYQTFSQTFEVHEAQKTIEVKLTSGMTKLNVQVTTQGGKPIDHADVVVKFVKGHSIILLGKAIHTSWEMRTNQEGIAKVPEIPQGTILIQVIATGYQTFGQTFEVNELEKTIAVKLNSPQEQYSAH
jgi:nitrogen fixation protein FixH